MGSFDNRKSPLDNRTVDAALQPLVTLLEQGPEGGGWLKAVFSHPEGEAAWQKLTAEPAALPSGQSVRLTSSANGRPATRHVAPGEWAGELRAVLAAQPAHINLLGRSNDWHARHAKSGRWLVSRGKPSLGQSAREAAPTLHDRARAHALPPGDPGVRALFIEIGLVGHSGQLRGEAAAKYRQVQHYIELLRPLGIWERPAGSPLRIVDAGCGRAYLSLALYLYAQRRGLEPRLIGVDQNAELLARVEASARRLRYEGASFRAESIAGFAANEGERADILVSLHACDTATDEALAAGIQLGAEAIVLVPCCHHEVVEQIERRMKSGEAPETWAAVLGSGLLRHRLADLVTDALRAAALEALGYRAETLEFASPEDTARNLMIRAERRPPGSGLEAARAAGLREYRALATYWQVQPALESLLGSAWPPH